MTRYQPAIEHYGTIAQPVMRENTHGQYYHRDEVRAWLAEVAALKCPAASGFEGSETFADCGECVVCRARRSQAD